MTNTSKKIVTYSIGVSALSLAIFATFTISVHKLRVYRPWISLKGLSTTQKRTRNYKLYLFLKRQAKKKRREEYEMFKERVKFD